MIDGKMIRKLAPLSLDHFAFNYFALIFCVLLSATFTAADDLRPREDGKVVLRLGGLPPPGGKGWEEYGRFLELNPGIKLKSVTGITVQGLDESKLFLAMAADMAPDVFDGSLREIQTFSQQRFCYPLDEFYQRDKDRLLPLVPNVLPIVYQDGKLIAIPWFYKVMALMHRRDLFEKYLGHDYDEPARDWNEWFEWCMKLTRPEKGQYGLSIYGGAWIWEIYVWLAGGEMVQPFKIDPKSGEAVKALPEPGPLGMPKFPDTNPSTGSDLRSVRVTWRATCEELPGIRALNFHKRLLWVEWIRPPDSGQELIFVDYPDYDTGKPVVHESVTDSKTGRAYRLKHGDPAKPTSDEVIDDQGKSSKIHVGVARLYAGKDDFTKDFMDGKIAIHVSNGGRDAVFDSNYSPSLVGLTSFPIGPPPTGHQATEMNARAYCINSQTKDPEVREAAWKFILFMSGDERRRINVKKWVEDGLAAFVLPEWLGKFGYADYVDEVPKAWVAQNRILEQNGKPEAAAPGFRSGFTEINNALSRIYLDPRRDAATELKSVVNYINRFLLVEDRGAKRGKERKVAWVVAAVVVVAIGFIVRRLWANIKEQAGRGATAEPMSMGRVKWRIHLAAWALMLPALIPVAIFAYYPLARGSVMAFQDYYILGTRDFVGLDNFIAVLTSPSFWQSALVTLEYVAMSLAIGFLAPIVLALMLSEIPWLKYFFRTVYFLPAVTSGLVIAFLWKQFFDPTPAGVINQLVAHLGIGPFRWLQDPKLAMLCVIIPSVWGGAGPGCLLYLAALKTVSDDLYEAADLDGAGWWNKIRHVMLPTIFPLIIINFIGSFIGAFHGMHNIFVMTAGGPDRATHILGLEIWFNAFLYLKFGYATAMAWVLSAVLLGFTVLQMKLLKKMEFRTAENA